MTTDPVAQASKNWWLFLILGLVSVIAGVLAIVYPGLTLLARGVFAVITAFKLRGLRHGEPGAAATA
jgi:uncharacterized membrane protein HdeD (DUF308 family)